MIPPDTATIDVYQDVDNTFGPWPWVGDDGVGIDLTGCTASFALRVSSSDAAPLVAITSAGTSAGRITLTLPADPNGPGLVLFTIGKSALMGVAAGDLPRVAHGDLVITFPGGQTIEYLAIDARIHPSRNF